MSAKAPTERTTLSMVMTSMFLMLLAGATGLYIGTRLPRNVSSGNDEVVGRDVEDGQGETGSVNPRVVHLPVAKWVEFGIDVRAASGGQIAQYLTLPGEVSLNADRVARMVPAVPGIARRVGKRFGDTVKEGESLVVLQSRELAEGKAAYLAAKQKLALSETNLAGLAELNAKGILPDMEFRSKRQEGDEAAIEFRAAEYKLRALGLTAAEVSAIASGNDPSLSTYEVRSPINGTIIDKQVALGELVNGESVIYTIADLSTVWVNLTVYQKDLLFVHEGQTARIAEHGDTPEVSATIDYISPLVEENTRTATARVVLPNADRRWRPGAFVTARLETAAAVVDVRVPRGAIQTLDEESVVFVPTNDGFRPQPVTISRTDDQGVEITAGLAQGQRYVAAGAFTLKSELEKAAFEADND